MSELTKTAALDAERSGIDPSSPWAALPLAVARHINRSAEDARTAAETLSRKRDALFEAATARGDGASMAAAFAEYWIDCLQRTTLTLDALRKRGDQFLEHQAAGAPPVLIYDYEVVIDGRDLEQPCNYVLLKIAPLDDPKDPDAAADERKRPYVIIDPRAGHGAGIGGFKPDSQVGVALKNGHPVYFVAFRPTPEPSQTIADVARAEAEFLHEVQRRHPDAPHPIVVGNCQGGWATAILAARNPDLVGPIVLNGAPMAYWSGKIGQDPMRYAGGVGGGAAPALLLSDLGGGVFDGAHLVLNFEMLNPGRTWFKKYYDLFAEIDPKSEARFLEFEKWWGGFYLLNEAEIRWIVENLFVGNRLSNNEARIEVGCPIDLKEIQAPIIVFASHGDNITPPQQALNWIVDTYADETEIEIRGQRIIYMVHEEVGHLGIFVSSSVARKEHTQMASTLQTIEALAPGLYEMRIREASGLGSNRTFTVDFVQRKMRDILALGDGRKEEPAFAAVARASEATTEAYDVAVRPFMKPLGAVFGPASRRLHPLRAQREVFASTNPMMTGVEALADATRANRRTAAADNPFLLAERMWADMIEQGWNMWRDARALATETAFLATYGNPFMLAYGASRMRSRAHQTPAELRASPEAQQALSRIDVGGFAEAVIRMLVLLADARGDVRRDRLERSAEILTTRPPFSDMEAADRARLIHEQTMIAQFEPDEALAALPSLIPTRRDRAAARDIVFYVVGALDDMEPNSHRRLSKMLVSLGFAALDGDEASGRAPTTDESDSTIVAE